MFFFLFLKKLKFIYKKWNQLMIRLNSEFETFKNDFFLTFWEIFQQRPEINALAHKRQCYP